MAALCGVIGRRKLLAGLWGGTWLGLDALSAATAAGSATPITGLPAAIASLRPSVVPVGTYSATDNPRFGFRGTGFAVGDGSLVATNFHVLPTIAQFEPGRTMAVLPPGARDLSLARRAQVVASDPSTDLTLLKIEGAPLPPLKLAPPGTVREGQSIGLMGFPIGGIFGFAPVTHRGIVASITSLALPAPTAGALDPRAIMRLRQGNFEVFQLDATAYPGNSGGPVFDVESAEVVAVINLVLVKGSRESALSNPTGISYAIPIRHLVDLLKDR